MPMHRMNAVDVDRYQAWYETPRGAYVLARETALLEHLIAGWPRRQQRLLQIGCGAGHFLSVFWRAGFEVSGLDSSPAMLEATRVRLGPAADLHLGVAEHLPFGDNEFDFTALVTLLELVDDPLAALKEAVRVSRKGVLVGFLNKHSLYCLTHGRKLPWADNNSTLRAMRWLSWWRVKGLLREVAGDQRACTAWSTLPGPMSTWKERTPWRQVNRLRLPPFVGAFGAVRLDLIGGPAYTPLMAFKPARPS